MTMLFTDAEVNAIAPPFSVAVLFLNVVLIICRVAIIPVTYIAPPVFPVLLVNVVLCKLILDLLDMYIAEPCGLLLM